MKLRTDYNGPNQHGPLVHLVEAVEGIEPTTRFCGYSHCRGDCGYPALFLHYQGREFKAHSSMVACGPVWQVKEWSGERVYVPESAGDPEYMIRMMMWR